MSVKSRIIACMVLFLLITSPGIPGEVSPADYHKIDPRLALMIDNSAMNPLVYNQLKRNEFSKNNTKINVLIKTVLNRSALEKFGVAVQAQMGNIFTATIPIEQISKLASHPQVSYIQSSATVSIQNDVSVPEIGATQVRSQYNLSGKGIIIGIVDTGIDWRHLDFRNADGTTRIIAMLDFSDPGDTNGDGSLDGTDQYGGTLYTQQEINNALQGIGTVNEKDIVGHGTHVAGSAAGNGRASGNGVPVGTYVGVAPEADLIIVKATRESGSTTLESIDYINAIAFIDSIANVLKRPYVANLSLGGNLGPHDGNDLSEQAIDNLLSASDSQGKAVVVSSGNDGDKNIHASGTFGNGITEIETKFSIPSYTSEPDNANDYVVFEGWYGGIFGYSVKIVTPGGTSYGPISSGREGGFQTDEGAIYISNAKGGPSNLNGDKQILIQIYDFDAAKPPKQGEWKITIMGSTGRFDLWMSGSSMDEASFTSNVDPSIVISTPGTAFSAITIGSYITKKNWIDLDGRSVGVPGLIPGDVSSFSSQGPTRDGRTKPEILAPGEKIAASYSMDAPPDGKYSIFKSGNSDLPNGYICSDGKHAVSQGTSFAAPHVSGGIALMFQKNPQLTTSQIREALIESARADQYTLNVPNNSWGYGKIEARGALQYITGQFSERKFTVSFFQNPALTQYIDFYLISKYALESAPTATIQVGGSTPKNIAMIAIESKTYKAEYKFSADGTAILKINATIQGESATTLIEYFGVKLLKANSGGNIGFDKVKLLVPQNSLYQDTYFTIIPAKTNAAANELQAISHTYQIGPANFTFNQPATLSISYDNEAVANLDESKISIYLYENNDWKRLSSSVDKNNNAVAALIDQPSTFRLFYDPNFEIAENLPTTFELHQNYPNPFNASTMIEYQLPYDVPLSIKIYNIEGKLVKILFDDNQQAGYHKIEWDGKNINDQPSASGMYICQLNSARFSMIRKMLLLK